MKFNQALARTAFMLASMAAAASVSAASLTINLAGWKAYGDFGNAQNTTATFSLPTGSLITDYSFTGLTYSTSNGSFLQEFVLSVNDVQSTQYMDLYPSTTFGDGTFGPANGSFLTSTNDIGGQFDRGAPFALSAGPNNLLVTVYDWSPDFGPNSEAVVNETVSAGTLTIQYTTPAIPEPGTYAMMGLGLIGLAAVARRCA